ncbi:MAG: hypothetical protein WA584_04310 [Pyrinomonadaceae bacterium]
MIGDYKPKKTDESSIRCKCSRNHERVGLVSLKVYRYRGFKSLIPIIRNIALPIQDITHYVLTLEAIVGLNMSGTFRIVSKHIMNRKRVAFVSNTTDIEGILVCNEFWKEIYE